MAAALLLFWFVGAYNRLVRMRASVLQAYGTLDVALRKQVDYVQARIDQTPRPNNPPHELPSSVAPLQAAATQLVTLLGVTRLRPLDAGGMAALATALNVLVTAWQRQYPDDVTLFEADGTLSRPAQLVPGEGGAPPVAGAGEPIPWPEPSVAAEIARNQFNQAVLHYNAAVRQFPAVLVAWAVRLKPAAPLL